MNCENCGNESCCISGSTNDLNILCNNFKTKKHKKSLNDMIADIQYSFDRVRYERSKPDIK